MLLVTHDVDEAVLLADRVLVIDQGRFALDLDIDLPAQRSAQHPDFIRYREQLLESLGVDTQAPTPSAHTDDEEAR